MNISPKISNKLIQAIDFLIAGSLNEDPDEAALEFANGRKLLLEVRAMAMNEEAQIREDFESKDDDPGSLKGFKVDWDNLL